MNTNPSDNLAHRLAMAELQIQVERSNIAALLAALNIDTPSDAPGHAALLAAGAEIRRLQAVEKAANSPERTLRLTDGDPAHQRRDLVVPVRVLVDASGVTWQLPCQLAVTLEHYAGQAQVLFWSPADAGNDPTFQFALDANLAATEPAE